MAYYLTAIVVCFPNTPNRVGKKYHNVWSRELSMERFERFAWKIPGATHINYYLKSDRSFYKQIRNPNLSSPL